MILHLFDDEKFVDIAISQFESVSEGKNIYFIEINSANNEPRFSKLTNTNIIADKTNSPTFKSLIKRINDFDAIILHGFGSGYKSKVVAKTKNHYFHWMSWGADLYSHSKLSDIIYLSLTYKYLHKSYLRKIQFAIQKYLPFLHKVLLLIKTKKWHYLNTFKLIERKVSSVSTVIPQDYVLIRNNISNKIKYLPFKYGSIEELVNGHERIICKEDNILIGNSATHTNNHLDAFEILKPLKLNRKKVFCPLSYGDKKYASNIIKVGKDTFQEHFFPLVDFIPLTEYNEILNNCGNVIMNHLRQQAMGNIILSLWKGARVFLNENNPVYSFLIEKNIIVFKTNELEKMDNLPDFTFLANHNRPILMNIYSRSNVLKETEDLVDYLLNKDKF